MRVRPFFWVMLVIVCIGVLICADLVTNTRTFSLRAQIDQILTNPQGIAAVRFHLMDSEEQPIDQATILLGASMPAMRMGPPVTILRAFGQGQYLACFYLSMTGLWHLVFHVSAPGFLPMHQLIMLQVS